MRYIIASLVLAPFFVLAQGEAALPKAGLTPGSPFYFFDKLGEAIQEFITFNPQAKARLQITFAAERIAEIKVVLETKGVEAKGLDVAQARLQANIARAAGIVSKEKSRGRDVSVLSRDLSDKFEAPKSALSQTFKEQKRALEAKEDELKIQLRAAHRAGDAVQEEAIAVELGKVKAQKELLELKEEDIDDDLEAEEEKIHEEMEAKVSAERAIKKAEEEKQEVIDEAAEEGVELAADAFVEFDDLLARAKSAFAAGNFAEAKNLAKQARRAVKLLERIIHDLEKNLELKEKAEEAIQEAQDEKEEIISEAREKGKEIPADAFVKFDRLLSQAKELFAKGNFQGAKQLAEQAEHFLDDVEKQIEKPEKGAEKQEERIRKTEEKTREKAVSELREFEISGNEYSFSPASITVKSGQKVKIKFRNHGGTVHNLIVEGLGAGSRTISANQNAEFEFIAPAAGTYNFYCSIANHRQLGMEGKLIVE